jgi:hypothetical protein
MGSLVNTAGALITTTDVTGIDKGVMTGLGGAVQQTGTSMEALGQGTGNNLGLLGQKDANIVALQLATVPLVVQSAGGAASSAGEAVAAIDNGQLAALSPATNPAGALMTQSGAAIASLSGNMTTAMNNAVVQQVTSSGSTMIHMIAIDVEATTQYLGASTGLGMPVNDLLVGTGLTVKQLGNDVTTTFAASPVLASTGAVVSSAGTLVAGVGGLVISPTASNNTAPSTFGNVIGSLSSGPATGTTPTAFGTAPTSVTSPISSVLGSLR